MLRANPHYTDVKSTVEQGYPEIQIRFDHTLVELPSQLTPGDIEVDAVHGGEVAVLLAQRAS